MELYLVRHGIAEDLKPGSRRSDAERRLTAEGRRKTRAAAKGLRALGVKPGRIGTRPLVRARETAELLREALGHRRALDECAFLAESPETARVVSWLRGRKCAAAMLVGHLPYLAETASELLTRSRGLDLRFRRAAACCLSFDGPPAAGRGKLEWLLQPQHLRALAR
jgi:phosphohistidine phosphatase